MDEINMLSQPMMRRLFLSDCLRLTDKAERLVLQLHLALGGDLYGGECERALRVSRGDIRDWRSYDDAVTYNQVRSREGYVMLWEMEFPEKEKDYTFVTRASADGSVSLTVTDGVCSVKMTQDTGEYMIPQVAEILQLALTEFLLTK